VTTALLFDRAMVSEVQDWAASVESLGRRSILWIDLDQPDREEVERVVESLELDAQTAQRLLGEDTKPFFGDFGSYLHVTAFAPSRRNGRAESVRIECLVAEHWLVTVHESPVEVFDDFRERMEESSGEIGRLEGPDFLADFLAWVLESYLAAFEAVELALEDFDERAMRGKLEANDHELGQLVELRQEIGRLRRALVSHRGMFLALAHPELEAITSSDHAHRFQTLRGQLEEVVQAARDSRDAVFGSFDVLIARSEHRTNEIMKVLTLGALLFLPGALIAGVLGMNFKIGLFETGWYFWVVCAVIVAFGATTLAAARARRWI
jgi:magnesium transporter